MIFANLVANLAVVGITFASVTMVLAAIGMFLRDLFAPPPDTSRQRLIFAPEVPEGTINASFFHLVEESGTPLDMQTWLAIVIGAAIVGAGVPLALAEHLLASAGGLVVGAAIPILYLLFIRWWRLGGMRKQLPYALQAVADAVRGGQTLSEACELVSKEIKGPLGQEFGYAFQQLELGHSPIAVMSRMSKAAHDKTDVRNHVLAMTAGSRLSAIGMVIAAVLAAVLLSWMEPEYIEVFIKNPKGPYLIATAIVLQIIGGIWVWRILKTSS
jgi:tight adherence protein B